MRPFTRKSLATASLIAAITAVGCTDDPTAPVTPVTAPPAAAVVAASPGERVEVSIGDTVQASTALSPSPHISWTVRDASVLRQLNGGLVLAIGAGSSYVVATGTHQQNLGVQDSTLVVVSGSTEPDPEPDPDPDPEPPTTGAGLWMSAAEIAALPTSGAAWTALESAADGSCGTPDLADQNQGTNVCVLAKALVYARTGQTSYRDGAVAAIRSIAQGGTYSGRALSLGRELAAYVIAADLIGLETHDSSLDRQFRAKLAELRTTPTSSGPRNLVDCHEKRPNNWGTMCGASRVAIAAYLGDRAELDRAATVFRGYLGDRAAYAGFVYGELSWQCDPSNPVGINPKGCVKDGLSLDGVMPDDQRRGGAFSGTATQENYAYEGLQGALTQALLLSRQGYDVWSWSDRALLRAFTWLHAVARFPAEGDDTWQPHLVNRVYGASFPAPVPSRPGKIAGFTDWTHAAD